MTGEQKRALTIAKALQRKARATRSDFDEVQAPYADTSDESAVIIIKRNGHTYYVRVTEYA